MGFYIGKTVFFQGGLDRRVRKKMDHRSLRYADQICQHSMAYIGELLKSPGAYRFDYE
jgi:hypothetical protein